MQPDQRGKRNPRAFVGRNHREHSTNEEGGPASWKVPSAQQPGRGEAGGRTTTLSEDRASLSRPCAAEPAKSIPKVGRLSTYTPGQSKACKWLATLNESPTIVRATPTIREKKHVLPSGRP